MIFHPRAALPILLAAAVLGAASPLLQAMVDTSTGVFYGPGVYIVTPAAAGHPLNMSLVGELRRQPWAQAVSPEAYAPALVEGRDVVVRGIEPQAFAAVEGLRVLRGSIPPGGFALAGSRLASRLGIGVNRSLVLTGSALPAIAQVRVTAVVETGGPSGDELLVPLRLASWLATLDPDGIALLRIRTAEPRALEAFFAGSAHPALVGGEGVGGGGDDRVANLILRDPRLSGVLGQPYVGTFARYGLNGVRLALDGFILFTGALFALGTASVVGKELVERAPRLGLLKALGATRPQLTLVLLRAMLPSVAPAVLGGIALGLFLAHGMGSLRPLVLFGHTVAPSLAPLGLLLLATEALGAVLLVALAVAQVLWRAPPVVLLGRAPDAWSPGGGGP